MNDISEAKQYLRENWQDGVTCPCCTQFVKLYKRRINNIMARGLIGLVREYRNNNGQPVHVHDIPLGDRDVRSMGGSFALLKHWGLIEPVGKGEFKRTSGFWRPTEAGIEFANNRSLTPDHLLMFNNKVYERSQEQVDIVTALGKHFDYNELMHS